MDNAQLSQGGNLNLVTAALAAHASNINLVIAVGTNAHIIDGQFYTRAAAASQAWTCTVPGTAGNGYATNGGFTGQTGGSTRLFGLFMDTAGALTVVPGPAVNTADLAAGNAALHWPAPQRNKVCFGCVRIAVTASTTFVPGVTALNAAGVTATYINLATIPAEPLRA